MPPVAIMGRVLLFFILIAAIVAGIFWAVSALMRYSKAAIVKAHDDTERYADKKINQMNKKK